MLLSVVRRSRPATTPWQSYAITTTRTIPTIQTTLLSGRPDRTSLVASLGIESDSKPRSSERLTGTRNCVSLSKHPDPRSNTNETSCSTGMSRGRRSRRRFETGSGTTTWTSSSVDLGRTPNERRSRLFLRSCGCSLRPPRTDSPMRVNKPHYAISISPYCQAHLSVHQVAHCRTSSSSSAPRGVAGPESLSDPVRQS